MTTCTLARSASEGKSRTTLQTASATKTSSPSLLPSVRFLIAILLITLLIVPTAKSFAAKPAPPPPPPPPPPVHYRIQYWDCPNPTGTGYPMDMNNHGQIVGWHLLSDGAIQGFLYDPALNPNNPNTAIDLDTVYRAPNPDFDGWKIHSASGINDLGVIAGKIDDPDGVIHGFLLDPLGIVLTPGIKVLPDFFLPGARISYLRVNDHGDVLTVYTNPNGSYGAYFFNYDLTAQVVSPGTLQDLPGPISESTYSPLRLNNPPTGHPSQVCGNLAGGTAFRWTSGPGGGTEWFSGPTVRGINDDGVLAGDLTSGKPSKRYPMRLSQSTPELLTGAPSHYGIDINNSRDVLLNDYVNFTSLLLFHNNLGYLDLDKLVTGSWDDLADWVNGSNILLFLNERDPTTNFGQIAGRLQLPDGTVTQYILTPEPIPAP